MTDRAVAVAVTVTFTSTFTLTSARTPTSCPASPSLPLSPAPVTQFAAVAPPAPPHNKARAPVTSGRPAYPPSPNTTPPIQVLRCACKSTENPLLQSPPIDNCRRCRWARESGGTKRPGVCQPSVCHYHISTCLLISTQRLLGLPAWVTTAQSPPWRGTR